MEVISVVITVNKTKIRICSAYGPQECEKDEDVKDDFWNYLLLDSKMAEENNQLFLLEMDSNAWVGDKLLSFDKNRQNKNGRKFEDFLNKRESLSLTNSSNKCTGQLTRVRVREGSLEESTIDHVVMSHSLEDMLEDMTIDEDGVFKLVNFLDTDHAIESDHHSIILTFNLFPKTKPTKRLSFFNFKNVEGLKHFKNATENNEVILNSFKGNDTLEEQVIKFKKELDKIITTSFKKIRPKNKTMMKPRCSMKMRNRNLIKIELKHAYKTKNKDLGEIKTIKDELKQVEDEIKDNLLEEKVKDLKDRMSKYTDSSHDNLSLVTMWKEFSKFGRSKLNSMPSAKLDHQGNLVTDEDEIVQLLAKEIGERMRKRPIRDDLKELDALDDVLFHENIKMIEQVKTPPFMEKDLNLALQGIKTSKARDHQGLSPLLLKNRAMGNSLKSALLDLVNRIKEEKMVTKSMNKVRVTCIPKAGSLKVLKNLRGIFNVLLLRSVLLKMIYNRNYESINNKFSRFSFGARKEKSSLNNVFIINAAINDVYKDRSRTPIYFNSVDYMQMFDGLMLKKCINTLINGGMANEDTLIL